MFDELANTAVLFRLWIGVETEIAIGVFDSCVQRPAVGAKAQTQQVTIVGRISHQESSIGLIS